MTQSGTSRFKNSGNAGEHRKGKREREPNRRAFPRWKATFEVRYGAGKELLEGKPAEIGEGGLAFIAQQPMPLETELTLHYRIAGGEWVKLKAIVRHAEGQKIGAEFLNLRMSDRLRLVDFISTLGEPDSRVYEGN
jgi:hypothetical protein